MPRGEEQLSESAENYLKTIYRLMTNEKTYIKPNVELEVIKIDKVNRVLIVRVGSNEHIVPLRVARVIMIRP